MDKFKLNNEDKKCAPSKKYTDDSCFNLESLQKIAQVYNERFRGDIPIVNDKKKLVLYLTKKIKECNNQLCWLDLNWVKKLNDDEIEKNTFRPKGPQGRFVWLSTTNINEIIEQYEHVYFDFLYLGTVPIDFEYLPSYGISTLDLTKVYNNGKKKLGIVFNLDKHNQKGSHWVSMFIDLEIGNTYFFDSNGTKPNEYIIKFVKKIGDWILKYRKLNPNFKYNKKRHQYSNSECGVYSINFILLLLNGMTIDEAFNGNFPDEQINKLREKFMRFE